MATLSDKPPTTAERIKMAKRECRRHLMKKTYDQATVDILETIQYRKVSFVVMMGDDESTILAGSRVLISCAWCHFLNSRTVGLIS